MIMYLVIWRPFKHGYQNWLEIFNESCVLASIPMLFCFSYYQNDTYLIIIFGWVFSGILMLNVGVNVIFAFYM